MNEKLRDKAVRTLRAMGRVPNDVRDYSQLKAEDVADIGEHDGYINVLLTDGRKIRLTANQLGADAAELVAKAPAQVGAAAAEKKAAVKK